MISTIFSRTRSLAVLALLASLLLALSSASAQARALRVVTTIPDLADLASRIGGDGVDAESLVRGPQDPHHIQARPSFISKLHRADLFIEMGLQLEIGWAPVLLQQARNPEIRPGGAGYLNASQAIAPLQVVAVPYERSMGDVHPMGNPHYLLDPLNGLRVAAAIRDKLVQLRPEDRERFEKNFRGFSDEIAERLVGPELAQRYDLARLVQAIEEGRAVELRGAPLGGWLGALRPDRGVRAVQDHRIFTYFADRFGFEVVAELEPVPGVAPTTRHLEKVVQQMQAYSVPIVLASPYFDARHARSVARKTGATVVPMAHQVGSREGTDDYLSMIDYNVRRVSGAL